MSDIALLCAGKVDPDPAWRIAGDCHVFHELIVVRSGAMTVEDPAGKLYKLGPGDAVLYPAGCRHAEASVAAHPVTTLFLAFDAAMAETAITVRRDREGRLASLCEWLYAGRLEDGHGAWRSACLALVLEEWRRLAAPESPLPEWVGRVNAWLGQTLKRRHTIDAMAARAGMSKFHFVRSYRRHCGVTPMAYLNDLRCREAEKLVRYTTLPFKEIALRTGFADAYALSKRLKKHCGAAPRELRRAAG